MKLKMLDGNTERGVRKFGFSHVPPGPGAARRVRPAAAPTPLARKQEAGCRKQDSDEQTSEIQDSDLGCRKFRKVLCELRYFADRSCNQLHVGAAVSPWPVHRHSGENPHSVGSCIARPVLTFEGDLAPWHPCGRRSELIFCVDIYLLTQYSALR